MDGRFSDREPATRGLVDLEYWRSLVSVVALRRRGTNVEISRDWEPPVPKAIERTLKSLQTNDFIKVMVGNVTVSTNDVPTADKPMELFPARWINIVLTRCEHMSESRCLDAADTLGARLCRDAVWSEGRCNWLADSMEFIESRWQVTHRAFGPELYNGTSGIALFLAYLFACTQERIFRKTAEGAIKCALSQADRLDPDIAFGFYAGLRGIAYALLEAGEIFGEEAFLKRGLGMLEKASIGEPGSSQSWDIVSGSSGIIPVLLKEHARYRKPALFDADLRHGDCVLQAARQSEEGWSWKTISDPGIKNLTGFSHGTAGIAWSLLELHNKSREKRFLHAVKEAIRYERHWFDPHQENWPDFRSPSTGRGIWLRRGVVSWCPRVVSCRIGLGESPS